MRLFGRQREWELLWREYQTAADGQLRIVTISGEPGIGKTHLMERLAGESQAAGSTVLRGGASEAEGMPPYLPFIQAFRLYLRTGTREAVQQQLGPHAPSLQTILPELSQYLGDIAASYALPPEQARLRLFDAVWSTISAITPRPVVVLLDDLHWADASTLDLLSQATRLSQPSSALIVCAYREAEADANPWLQRALVHLSRHRILTPITLERLSRDELAALAAAYLEADVDQSLEDALELHSEGNPFFAEELLRGWTEAGSVARFGPRWILDPAVQHTLPPTIVAAVRDRVARLPAETTDSLRVAALIGRAFDISILAAARGQSVEAQDEQLQPAVAARLIRVSGGLLYEFRHDTVRECLYTEVSMARRQRLHRAIGSALEADGRASASDLAFQFAHSDDRERGIHYALAAAQAVQAGYAFGEARRHFDTALDLLDLHDERRGSILLHSAEVTLSAGKEAEAAEIFEAARSFLLSIGDRSGAAQAAHGLGSARWRQGRLEEARIAFETALTLVPPPGTSESIRTLIDLASLLNMSSGQQARAVAHAQQALDLASDSGDRGLAAAATRVLGQLVAWSNDIERGIDLLEEALVLALAADDPAEAADTCGILSNVYFASFEVEQSRQRTLLRMDLARRCGQPYELRHVHSWLAELSLQQGNWSETEALIEQAQAVLDRLGSDEPRAVLHRVRGRLAEYRDRPEEAECHYRAALDLVKDKGPQHLAWYLGPLGVLLVRHGKRTEARTIMAALHAAITTLPKGHIATAPGRTALVEIAVELGDRQYAERHVALLRAFSRRMFLSVVDIALARYEMARGDTLAADRYLKDAEHDARRTGLRPQLIDVLQLRLELELGRDAPRRVTAPILEDVLRLCTDLGLEERGQSLSKQYGSPGLQRRPMGLSKREVEVLRLVAMGKSNREIAQELFLSEKTVENHVTSILNKTTTTNRAAATAFAARHDLI